MARLRRAHQIAKSHRSRGPEGPRRHQTLAVIVIVATVVTPVRVLIAVIPVSPSAVPPVVRARVGDARIAHNIGTVVRRRRHYDTGRYDYGCRYSDPDGDACMGLRG